ncbi:hypothetical protein AAFX91_38450 [Bradyrhizobium sp. 31Argb]|uniref:hypothetical protein n=1 Tax=Bradyrhizobium sp. 31Argb TaxID=3141247 RepID=UPI00374791D6
MSEYNGFRTREIHAIVAIGDHAGGVQVWCTADGPLPLTTRPLKNTTDMAQIIVVVS